MEQDLQLFSARAVQRCLAELKIVPSKKWGQNFLIDSRFHQSIVELAAVGQQDHVLEIGPGLGHLTQFLLERAREVLAVEIDTRLCQFIIQRFAKHPGFHLYNGDILSSKHTINPPVLEKIEALDHASPWKLISNLPYSIATPVIRNFLGLRFPPSLMVFTIQQEVAERLLANPDTEAYGVLSLYVRLYAEATLIQYIPPAAFYPQPQVRSAIVQLTPIPPRFHLLSTDLFAQVVQAAFQSRRKTLWNALRHNLKDAASERIEQALALCRLAPNRRGETLSLEEFVQLTNALAHNDEENKQRI